MPAIVMSSSLGRGGHTTIALSSNQHPVGAAIHAEQCVADRLSASRRCSAARNGLAVSVTPDRAGPLIEALLERKPRSPSGRDWR